MWSEVDVVGESPTKRYGHTLTFTSPYVVLFGGNTGNQNMNDSWYVIKSIIYIGLLILISNPFSGLKSTPMAIFLSAEYTTLQTFVNLEQPQG